MESFLAPGISSLKAVSAAGPGVLSAELPWIPCVSVSTPPPSEVETLICGVLLRVSPRGEGRHRVSLCPGQSCWSEGCVCGGPGEARGSRLLDRANSAALLRSHVCTGDPARCGLPPFFVSQKHSCGSTETLSETTLTWIL